MVLKSTERGEKGKGSPCLKFTTSLRSFASDSSSELDVLGHDGDSLGVDGAQVGVLEEADQVSFGGFLESEHGRALEPEIGLVVLGELSHESLEGELSDQELSRLLVSSDLSESHGTGSVSVRLLHAASGGSGLSSGLGGELLSGGLASGRLTSGLLGSSHGWGRWDCSCGRIGTGK